MAPIFLKEMRFYETVRWRWRKEKIKEERSDCSGRACRSPDSFGFHHSGRLLCFLHYCD